MSIGERIKEARINRGIGQTELADRVGISKQSLYKYENDIITNIPSDKVEAIARVLHTTPAYLMGWDTPQPSAARYFRVPVLGSVHAGYAHDLIQEPVLDYEDLSSEEFRDDEKEYFCLRIRGDCMTPRICEGDVVVVHKQPDAESGSIVVAAVNAEEGFCKRLQKYPDTQSIALISLNPAYPPRIFSAEEIRSLPVTIVGVVVELRAKMI